LICRFELPSDYKASFNADMSDLKQKIVRGGVAKVCAQAANFVLRVGSLMLMARLLEPGDFGLVGMVTAITGVLNLFRDFGLSAAAVQRSTISEEEASALFWINVLVGGALAVILAGMGPLLASFYHEPRLLAVSAALATSFLFNAAGVQHSALLQRQMRFATMAAIDTTAWLVSIAVGLALAIKGCSYWSLVIMTIALPLVSTCGLWIASSWVPGRPQRHAGIASMMRFGGTLTLNGLVVHVAYNLDKVLLGRVWGAQTLGLYGRAYQLINIPTDNLNTAVGEVAFSGLSRVKENPVQFRNYFLKGYSLVLAVTVPITFFCAAFAKDLVLVLLGAKWRESTLIFRFLAPTILTFAIINPLGWLLFSLGMVGRSLKVALVLAPIVIAGYFVGLPYGARGVALAYSVTMALWIVPHVYWCTRGTVISVGDVFGVVKRPLIAASLATILGVFIQYVWARPLAPLPRLLVSGSALCASYLFLLLVTMGQKRFYLDLFTSLRKPSSMNPELASLQPSER
jgi:O-antigen/teichoic acid export membrane protein